LNRFARTCLLLSILAIAFQAQGAVTGTLVGTQLRVNLTAPADKARVTADGSGNILVVDDTTAATVFTTPAAGVQSLQVVGTNSVTQQVTLDGALSLPAGVAVLSVGTLLHVGDYNVGASTYTATAAKNIFVGPDGTQTVTPARIQTSSNAATPISLTANSSGTVAGTFIGVEVQAGILTSTSTTTNTGNISLRGHGGNVAGGNHGIAVDGSATITAAAGRVLLTGTGGAGSGDGNVGVRVQGDGTQVTGPIEFDAVGGGAATSSNNYGIEIAGGALISAPASFLDLNGTGGPSTGTGNSGIVVHGSGAVAGATTVTFAAPANFLFQLTGVPGGGTSAVGLDIGNGGGTVSSTGVGTLFLSADSINIDTTSAILSAVRTVSIVAKSTTAAVNIGAGNSSGVLGLTLAELARITSTTQTVSIAGGTGGLSVTVPVTVPWQVFGVAASGPINGPGPVHAANFDVTDTSFTPRSWVIDGTGVTEDSNVKLLTTGGGLFIVGGSGSDVFTVTPTSARTITINGGNPTPPASPGDVLVVTQAATALNSTLGASGYSGSVSFSGASPVSFQNIESGNVAPSTFAFSVPANATAGVPFPLTVTVVDTQGAVVNTYSGTVHFTSSDSGATLPANSMLVNGSGTFMATLSIEGLQTLTATDTVKTTLTGTSSAIPVSPAAASYFTVSAPASVAEGSPFSFTVTAFDAFNNVATNYAGSVHFTSSDGGATLPVDSTLVAGTGTFNATLRTLGSQSVSASDSLTPSVTGSSAAIGVTVGPPTHLSVSSPASATAGVATTVTVAALDVLNNVASSYAGTVHFTSSDGSSVLPANVTLVGGIATLPVTFKTSGSQTVTATDTVATSFTATSNAVTVSPAAATHFSLSTGAAVTAGVASSVSITALDAFNNTATTYAGSVHFTSTDSQAVLPANSTLVAGAGTFAITLKTAGAQTITGSDAVASSITGTSNSATVSSAAATHFGVSAPATATAGSAFTFTVTALDAFNNSANSYAGTVHFTSSDSAATLPSNATLTSGTGTFSATLTTAGSETLTATDTVSASTTGTSPAITVSASAATHLKVTAPASATAGTAITVTVTALDASNNTATGYTGTVHFTSSDGAAVLPADATLSSGTATFSVTLKTSGSQTVTATDTVASSLTASSPAITVAAGAATHVSLAVPSTASGNVGFAVTVTALDAFGNIATGYAGTIHFTSTDPTANLPADITLSGGVGTFTVTLNTAGSRTIAATDTVTATITGTSAAVNVVVNSYSAPSATGTGMITASFTGGGATCSFSAPQFIGAPPGSPPVPPTLPQANTSFPQGMFDFSLVGCTAGSTITMTITYPGVVTGMQYWKYGPEAANPTPHWYVMPATLSGNTAIFSITDGGQGDDDLAANGVIEDQGGPGFGGGNNVPAMSWWMMVLTGMMLVLIGGIFRNRLP
jgi:hypothetical protein